jgi:uncharacterized protein YfaS (alpha-2-macroglobulin family)
MQINAWILAGAAALSGLWMGAAVARTGPADAPAVILAAQDGVPLEGVRPASAPRAGARVVRGMQFVRLRTDTTTAIPRACFEFSMPLDPGVNYVDYFQITPAAPVTAEVSDRQVCLSGLGFQPDREVVVREGVPAAGGKERTPRSETVTVAFGDRPTFVGFAGRGTILPRAEADGLGIETVNVSRLEVEVLRVGDRILGRQSIDPGTAVSEGDWNFYSFEEAGADVGVPIWKGTVAVRGERNAPATTVFPLGSVLRAGDPGAYVVRVRDAGPGAGLRGANGDTPAAASRWIVNTDMAIQTFQGSSGLDVVVRSIASARPLGGVRVALLGANNDLLSEGTTTGEGRVRFEAALMRGEGPDRARYVMAYGQASDFAALDLERPAVDLSSRAVEGRARPRGADAFLYTERGVYRPGETVRLTGLVRDRDGSALGARGATLVLRRPNGTEATKLRADTASHGGALQIDYALSSTAPRGMWTAEVTADGETTPAGKVGFAVEDFVPQRLKVEVDAEVGPLLPGTSRAVSVDAQFLYGAPGAGLRVDGSGRLMADPRPFERFAGFAFGREEDAFADQIIDTVGSAVTDAQGRAVLDYAPPADLESLRPLMARLDVEVTEPGGRAVGDRITLPVRTAPLYVGIRPVFENRQVDRNAEARFEVVALDAAGAPQARRGLSWTLVEEEWTYDWYMQDGEWRWRSDFRDRPVISGTLDVGAGGPATLARRMSDDGRYRLIVRDDASGVETSLRFTAGWNWGATQEDRETPDTVQVDVPDQPVRRGQNVRLGIRSPYAGEAQIVVATDEVVALRTVSLRSGTNMVDLRSDESWGAGAHVLVTVMTPRSATERPIPRRAVGVGYVPIDMADRTLQVELTLPEKVVPRQRLSVPIRVRGVPSGDRVHLTLAAVDEGILQITRFESPDAPDWYHGRRALTVDLRDDYGRLLNPNLDAAAETRAGGDGGIGGEALTVVPTRTVALFSGVVTVEGGRATIELDIPDFNGQLRLMAVAWSQRAVGSLARPLTVRDPVVADLTLPRFLAPGDAAQATLLLDNVEGRPGPYTVTVAGSGATAAAAAAQTFTLDRAQRTMAVFPVSAPAAGLGEVTMTITGPGGFRVTRGYPIQARPAWMAVTETSTNAQAPATAFTLTSAAWQAFQPGTVRASVSYSALRGLDPGPIFDSLERYPYGCTEQLVSVAMPLLYSGELASAGGRADDPRLRARVQDAINRILDRQSDDGSFGLWAEGDNAAAPWLGAYTVDFLRRAKDAGYAVPDAPMALAYRGLRPVVRADDWAESGYRFAVDPWRGNPDTTERLRSRSAAYALYVMAKGGEADIGQLRYWADARLEAEPSPLARAQVGAALAHLGDRARAREAFRKAEQALGHRNEGDWYQSPVRDMAGVLMLAVEAGQPETAARVATMLSRTAPDADSLMTQEKAWLVLAAHSMFRHTGQPAVAVGGAAPAPLPRLVIDPARIGSGLALTNRGTGPIWRTVSVTGVPLADPGPLARGLTIAKSVRALDGSAVDLGSLAQGTRVVVVLSVRSEGARTVPAILVDLLPAGLEVEGALRPEDGASPTGSDTAPGPFAWAGVLEGLRTAEARDDRFVAALDLSGAPRTVAYIARAVTPGSYVLPGAQVEDMYRPGVVGRSATARLTVLPPRAP